MTLPTLIRDNKHTTCPISDKRELAAKALEYIGWLYEIERESKDLPPDKRLEIRQTKAEPLSDALYQWMLAHRQKVPDGSGTVKALNYSLKRWEALTRYLEDRAVPIDNSWVENQSGPGHLAVPTGFSQGHYAVVSVRRRS